MVKHDELYEYFNSLFRGLKKEFYSQRAEGMRFRTVLVGVEYLRDKLHLDGGDLDENLSKVSKLLKEVGVAEINITTGDIKKFEEFPIEGRLVTADVRNCIHRDTDMELHSENVPLVTFCPVANALMYAIDNSSDATQSELVSVKASEAGCVVKVAAIKENGGE